MKRNVVVITIDECKASALNCYGNSASYTPNINKLVEQGALFNHAFTSMPKCVPSRVGMVTGRYAHVDGHRSIGLEINEGEHTIFNDFKVNGYTTAIFGKNSTVKASALSAYFDVSSCNYQGAKLNTNKKETDSSELYRAMYRDDYYKVEQLSDYLALKDTCQFIASHSDGDKPFFLLFNIAMPHPVYVNVEPFASLIDEANIEMPPKQELANCPTVLRKYRETFNLDKLSDMEWKKIIRAYYSMLSFSDYCVGKVIETLAAEGLDEHTLVVLTSDHGDFTGEHGCVEKWDTLFYDCLIKVPLIMKLPGVISENIRPNSFVENVDLMPTILDLCELNIPLSVQGKSMRLALEDVNLLIKDRVFAEGGLEQHSLTNEVIEKSKFDESDLYYTKQQVMLENPLTMSRAKMVRTDEWKFIYRIDSECEMYNIKTDPNELTNLAGNPLYDSLINTFKESILNWLIMNETAIPPITKLQA